MKKIYPWPTTKIKDPPFAFVDDEDYLFLSKFRWFLTRKIGAKNYYFHTRVGKHWILMDHIILTPYAQIDHINHNTCDNRKVNLRPCNTRENSANRIKQKGTSRFKGVHWHKRDKVWEANIKVMGKGIHLGNFYDERRAAIAYNKAAIEQFGEFANLNNV